MNFIPACFSMFFRVSMGMSFTGCVICICQPKNRSKGHRILGHFLANIVPPKSIQRHMFLIFMLYCLIFEIEGCPVFS